MEVIVNFFQDAIALVQTFTLYVILVLGAFLALVFIAFQFGKSRIVTFIFSLYIALLLFQNFPYTETFVFLKDSDFHIWVSNILIFLAIAFLVQIIVGRAVDAEFPDDLLHTWFEVLVLAASGTALLLAFVYHALPASAIEFSPEFDQLFASPELYFWWLILPLIAMFFVVRRYL